MALYVASHRGHSDAVQYLLEHGNSGRKLPIFMSWDFFAGRKDRVSCVPGPSSSGFLDLCLVSHQSGSPWDHSLPV